MSAPHTLFHERRPAALALTVLVHALLLLGWQVARRLPPLPAATDTTRIQWIDLSRRLSAPPKPAPARLPAQPLGRVHPPERARAHAHEAAPPAITVLPAPASSPTAAPAAAAPAPSSSAVLSASPPESLVRGALRAAGSVAGALRKENRAYIVAPPDSPQMRMQRGMQAAHDMVPPKLWEAPKIEELVNNTGDGTRHTRVITGNGTYCINERSTHVSIDTVETLGKVTPHLSCPEHETPAGAQEWKTARD